MYKCTSLLPSTSELTRPIPLVAITSSSFMRTVTSVVILDKPCMASPEKGPGFGFGIRYKVIHVCNYKIVAK